MTLWEDFFKILRYHINHYDIILPVSSDVAVASDVEFDHTHCTHDVIQYTSPFPG